MIIPNCHSLVLTSNTVLRLGAVITHTRSQFNRSLSPLKELNQDNYTEVESAPATQKGPSSGLGRLGKASWQKWYLKKRSGI